MSAREVGSLGSFRLGASEKRLNGAISGAGFLKSIEERDIEVWGM